MSTSPCVVVHLLLWLLFVFSLAYSKISYDEFLFIKYPCQLSSLLQDKKITKTSFLDDAFRKNLESALRFGNPLLVQDVESYDAILNPVLNKELRRTGGRILITLGDQDIDLSPSFTIFLSTRDPSVEFAPDLCSRVTFVNFTGKDFRMFAFID